MAASPTLPLVDRGPEEPFAVSGGVTISVGRFLREASALAALLPPGGGVINLARDRYRFQVAYVAAILRGACTLLPPNDTIGAQSAVATGRGAPLVLHDGVAVADGLPELDLREAPPAGAWSGPVPAVVADDITSISFTSGSTGAGSEVARSWRTHYEGAALNGATYLGGLGGPFGMVATVPPQHMYGMEVTVMAPLCLPVTVSASRPLYPADVAAALAAIPTPRVLVSTPLHLKALVASDVRFPAVERVITATAPISQALAGQVEDRLGAVVVDVYGCSETGCLATRRVAKGAPWQVIPGFKFNTDDDGVTRVSAAHLPAPVALQDRLRLDADGTLHLAGRASDLVNVAGKRASLANLTALLMAAPGVEDGVVFQPRTRDGERLAALYCGSARPETVRAQLRAHLDPVLLPRPLRRVDALPRNATGKLPLEALEQALLAPDAASRSGGPKT